MLKFFQILIFLSVIFIIVLIHLIASCLMIEVNVDTFFDSHSCIYVRSHFVNTNWWLPNASDCVQYFTCVILFHLQQQPNEVGSPLVKRRDCGLIWRHPFTSCLTSGGARTWAQICPNREHIYLFIYFNFGYAQVSEIGILVPTRDWICASCSGSTES